VWVDIRQGRKPTTRHFPGPASSAAAYRLRQILPPLYCKTVVGDFEGPSQTSCTWLMPLMHLSILAMCEFRTYGMRIEELGKPGSMV
jgi:hypothetical protein